MKQKTKAIVLIALYALVTTADCLLTWIGNPALDMEANPLVSVFGLGWGALLLSNVLVLALYALLVWYCFVVYKRPTFEVASFGKYIGALDHETQNLPIIAATGFAMGIGMPLGRMVPVIDWAVYVAGYVIPKYEAFKRKMPFGRPDLCLILILAILLIFVWYYKEYKINQENVQAQTTEPA